MLKKIFLTLVLVFVLSPAAVYASNFPNPLGKGTNDPSVVIGKLIQAVLGVVGSIALLMFVYGGLLWMTAAGAPDRITKGKDTLIWAVLGLVVIFSSYALVDLVLKSMGV